MISQESSVRNGAAVGHEERDTNIRAILWFAVSLVATLVVVLLVVNWVFRAFPKPEAEISAPLSAVPGAVAQLPPEPRLQVNAPEDLKKLREEEDSVLNSYGWVDKQKGIVRIPIDRAIEILARRGLPPLKPAGK
jgi:hypothetical protein